MLEINSTACSSSSSPLPPDTAKEKPVIVRLKRKLTQARFDAFWLEINERPSKRPLLDFGRLVISDSTTQQVEEEPKSKKLFVQHAQTVTASDSDAIGIVLQPFLTDSKDSKDMKIEERRRAFKSGKKPDELKQVAKQKHEERARNARFEQIWKSRKDSLKELCQLYDVLQVDPMDETPKTEKKRETTVEDEAILCNYLPLVREYIPSAAAEIEADILSEVSSEENYVYDLYTVEKDGDIKMDDSQADYPLLQVNDDDDDDYYDGPKSDYDTEDSNAEDNPLFDYPDEEDSDDEEERDPYDYCEYGSDIYEREIVDLNSDDDEDQREY